MIREKEFADNFNKPNEAIKYFEQLLKSPRSSRDTTGLGYTSTEEGEYPKLLKKEALKVRIPNLLVISMERKDIQLMSTGVRMLIRMQSQNPWLTVKNAINKDIRHMNVGLEPQRYLNLKDIATNTRSMDIEHLNVDLSLLGHQTR